MAKNKFKEDRDVVVVLPYKSCKILTQLRDFNQYINFPGHWGFFGGSIKYEETPYDAALREITEEISYKPKKLYRLDKERLPYMNNIQSHSFYFSLNTKINNLRLTEGLDMKFVSLEDIQSKMIYSNRLKKSFPVVPVPFIVNTIKKVLYIKKQIDLESNENNELV